MTSSIEFVQEQIGQYANIYPKQGGNPPGVFRSNLYGIITGVDELGITFYGAPSIMLASGDFVPVDYRHSFIAWSNISSIDFVPEFNHEPLPSRPAQPVLG